MSARSDTARTDTTKTSKDTTSVSGVDTLVSYSCVDSIVYDIQTREMSMFTRSDIRYRQMALKAERVDVNWNTSTLTSFGVPDTVDSSRSKPNGAVNASRMLKRKFRGTPVMKDGNEEYHGMELGYNFKTKKGIIDVGDTQIEQGYYHGEEIKKVDKDVLFVSEGRYTSCDDPDPHYYFFSPRMKVTLQDAIVAEPVYFYVADVPVFVLPLGVFPNKGGRRSGIITPAYGEDPLRGKFLSHLGYYWAINDYVDWNFRTDLFTKGGYAAYSDYRYALRYYFSGSITGEYKNLHTGESTDPSRTQQESYRLNLLHNQDIDPTTRLNVNFTFASNNSYLNTIDLQEALDQSIISNATLSKYWEGTPNSMSVNISRSQNLIDGSISEVLPSLNFNHSQSFPFRRGKSSSDESSSPAWYELIGVSYSANASNNIGKVDRKVSGVMVNDTLQTVDAFEQDRSQSLNQNLGISIAPKLGYFTVSPSLNYSDSRSWTNNEVPDTVQQSLYYRDDRLASRSGTISSGISASTRMYGIFQPNRLGVAAFRHTMTPSLSFTYQKQIIGENLPPREMFANLNVGNVFEMKTQSDTGEGTKIQLLNLGLGISYNFTADSLQFSELGTNFRTNVGSLLDVSGGASFNLYKRVQTAEGYADINKFLITEEHRLARLTSFNLSFSTTLAGEKNKSDKHKLPEDTLAEPRSRSGTYGLYQEEEPDFSIPWRLSLSLDYSEGKVQPSTFRAAAMRGNLEFNLTENWKFTVSGGYDILNKQIEVPDIHINRDLHCWLMNFDWVPLGTYRHFQLEIRVKAPQLHDIKVTKSGSERGIY